MNYTIMPTGLRKENGDLVVNVMVDNDLRLKNVTIPVAYHFVLSEMEPNDKLVDEDGIADIWSLVKVRKQYPAFNYPWDNEFVERMTRKGVI